jgi:hypothetical protein
MTIQRRATARSAVASEALALQDEDSRVGQRSRQRRDVGPEELGAVLAGQQQGRDGDVSSHCGIERSFDLDTGLAGDRVRGGDTRGPRGLRSERAELVIGHPKCLTEDRLDDLLASAVGQQRIQPLQHAGRVGVRGRSNRWFVIASLRTWAVSVAPPSAQDAPNE